MFDMSNIDVHARALGEFCRDSSEVEAFNLDRTTGPNPAFAFLDAAGRLVMGDERSDPSVILIVTPEEGGLHVSLVKASKHAAPLLVAMEHHDAHEDVVGFFATPQEAFAAALAIVDESASTPSSPYPSA
jgi:hypothetical protein